MSDSFVLMYHRVCERQPSTRCWFERGTAVTPAAFERQLGWLVERFAIVPLDALLASPSLTSRPRVALTFDDGYTDTLEFAAPICGRHGVTATCFAPAGPAMDDAPLWFDTWYALAGVGLDHPEWLRILAAVGLPPAADLASCVTGPLKQRLATASSGTRSGLLDRLAWELGVPAPRPLQLDLAGLRRLRALGWRIGGHGVEHVRLTDVDRLGLERELAGSRRLLAEVEESGPLQFAYPDGAWSDDVVSAVAASGFAVACTTDRGPWTPATLPMLVPRLFCRGDASTPHRLLTTPSSQPEATTSGGGT